LQYYNFIFLIFYLSKEYLDTFMARAPTTGISNATETPAAARTTIARTTIARRNTARITAAARLI
jgi:hypothetical protein